MKKILLGLSYVLLILFCFPVSTFAFTYSRSPSGSSVTSPITVDVSFLEEDMAVPFVDETYWCVYASEALTGNHFGSDENYAVGVEPYSGTFHISIPENTDITAIEAQGMVGDVPCIPENGGENGLAILEFDGGNNIFSVVGDEGITSTSTSNDSGDIVFSLAWIIFFQAMIFFGIIFNTFIKHQ